MATRKTFKGDDPPPHGDVNRYRYHDKCRCKLCKFANTQQRRIDRTGKPGPVPEAMRVMLWRARNKHAYNEYMRIYRKERRASGKG